MPKRASPNRRNCEIDEHPTISETIILPSDSHDHSSNHRWLSNGSGPGCVIEVTRPYVSNSHMAVQGVWDFRQSDLYPSQIHALPTPLTPPSPLSVLAPCQRERWALLLVQKFSLARGADLANSLLRQDYSIIDGLKTGLAAILMSIFLHPGMHRQKRAS